MEQGSAMTTGVREVEVRGLFGLFDHRIPVGPEGLTIVHGPNGSGKTMILRIIHFLCSGNYEGLRELPFDSAVITLDSGMKVVATRAVAKKAPERGRAAPRRSRWELTLSGAAPDGQRLGSWAIPRTDVRRRREAGYEAASYLEVALPHLQRLSAAEWFDNLSAETLSALDVLSRYGEELPPEAREFLRGQSRPAWVEQFEGEVPTRFISAERLIQITPAKEQRYHREEPVIEPTVTVYARKLAAEIQSRLTDLSKQSAELDRTFPERVFAQWSQSERDQSYIRLGALESQLNDMKDARKILVRAGMAPPGELIGFDSVPNTEYASRMLAVYLGDLEQKNSVVKPTADRVNLFLDLVNDRLMMKEIQLDEELGFLVKTASGSIITPDRLSSGEQHEVVITYELLFEVPEGALVLMDEPELSLHVHWQLQFLHDIEKIRQVAPFSLLVATHSPQIVNEEWDKTVRLERPAATEATRE